MAIGPTRLLRMEPGTAAISRSWRYSALRQWNVNWDSRQVGGEKGGGVKGWGVAGGRGGLMGWG